MRQLLQSPVARVACELLLVVGAATSAAGQTDVAGTNGLPRVFEENRGQFDGRVRYASRGPGYQVLLTDDGLTFGFERGGHLGLRFTRGTPGALAGVERLPGHVNYLLGRTPASWVTGVPTFSRVRRSALYDGIDAVFYAHEGRLEFDLELASFADPGPVGFELSGEARLAIDHEGALVADLPAGQLRLPAPYVYQQTSSGRRKVDARYVLQEDRLVTLALGKYEHARPLVVDPEFVYASYLGGSDFDAASRIVVDAAGNRYITGTTSSFDFPLAGPVQPALVGGATDAFVAKLDATGSQLLYATYLGGSSLEVAEGLAVDAAGHAYVSGHTQSSNFPLVAPLQSSRWASQSGFIAKLTADGAALVFATYFGSGRSIDLTVDSHGDIFVVGAGQVPALHPLYGSGPYLAKLHASGQSLWYATPLGGIGPALAEAVQVDASSRAVVAGYTRAADFPIAGGVQAVYGGGLSDGFVARYVGVRQSIALLADTFDAENGGSPSPSYTSFAAFQVAAGVASLLPDGAGLGVSSEPGIATTVTSTTAVPLSPAVSIFPESNRTRYRLLLGLVGASGGSAGAVSVRVGSEFADTFNVSAGSAPLVVEREFLVINPTTAHVSLEWSASSAPPVVAALSLSALHEVPELDFSTYLGGNGDDAFHDLRIDGDGRIVVAGETTSTNLPVLGPVQGSLAGGSDAVIVRLDPTGSALGLMGYLGGTQDDVALAVATDDAGAIVVGGSTTSADFPVLDPVPGSGLGLVDGFVARLDDGGALRFASLVGGTGFDIVTSVAPAAGGAIHLVGQTNSVDLPLASPLQPLNAGTNDAFVATIASDAQAPLVVCGHPDGTWHATDIVVSCTASDAGVGLANAEDAHFTLATSVAPGVETSTAITSSRTVCDRSGNCAVAGPIGPHMVDKRPPAVLIASPTASSYVLGSSVVASYSCTDGGAGVASCVGTSPTGAGIPTSAAGHFTFRVTAADAVSNTAEATVAYDVGYGVCLDYDPGRARQAGSTLPIKLRLCDARGTNLSSASVTVTATSIFRVSDNAPGPLEDSGQANPDLNFRHVGDSGASAAYLFNLSLKGLTTGTWGLRFAVSGDPTSHVVQFQVK